MVAVRLLRPLDGKAVGDRAEYPAADAQRLAERGVVTIIRGAKAGAPPANKMAPSLKNKAASPVSKKKDR